jgi:hypothetical protein
MKAIFVGELQEKGAAHFWVHKAHEPFIKTTSPPP